MEKDPEFIERLKLAVEQAGGQALLAKKTGLSKSVISKYVNGYSEPDRKRLIKIADAGGVDVGWLATGIDTRSDTAALFLPFYSNNLKPDQKRNSVSVREQLVPRDTPYPVSAKFLNHILGVKNVEDLGAFLVHGDCMVPTLNPNEVVIVDLTAIDLVEGIHLIVDKTGIHYRRIKLPHGKPVELYSDNAEMYETEPIAEKNLSKLQILGRVIWHGKRM